MWDSIVDKSVVCVDWDARTLRLVLASVGKRSTKVTQVLGVPIPSDVRQDDAESFGAFLREALDKAGIRTKRAATDIARDQVNLYTLNLPKAKASDMAAMVAYRIPKELSFPVDQAAVDFTMPSMEDQDETNDVLVAAVRKETLAFRAEVFEHAGLKLHRIGLRPNSNQFAVNALLRAAPADRALFIDVGPTITEIDVIHAGRLVFSRAAAVTIPSSFDETPEEAADDASLKLTVGPAPGTLDEVVRELMIEVTRSIEAYRATDPGVSVDYAVVGGACDVEEALAEAIQKQYNITAQPYNPATCFGWDADRGAGAGAFAAPLGLALSLSADEGGKFNFLTPKRPETRAQRQIKRAPIVATAAALLMTAGAVGYFQFVKPQYDLRDELRAEIDELEDDLKKHAEFKRMVGYAQRYEQQRIVWLDELHDLFSALPDNKELVLKDINMKQGDHKIVLGFRAKNSGVDDRMVNSLVSFRRNGQDVRRFEVTQGMTSDKPGEAYPHSGNLRVSIIDREWDTDKK